MLHPFQALLMRCDVILVRLFTCVLCRRRLRWGCLLLLLLWRDLVVALPRRSQAREIRIVSIGVSLDLRVIELPRGFARCARPGTASVPDRSHRP